MSENRNNVWREDWEVVVLYAGERRLVVVYRGTPLTVEAWHRTPDVVRARWYARWEAPRPIVPGVSLADRRHRHRHAAGFHRDRRAHRRAARQRSPERQDLIGREQAARARLGGHASVAEYLASRAEARRLVGAAATSDRLAA